MSTDNLDSHNLKSALVNGLINEDVMQQIWNISKIPLPFTDLCGTDSHGNEYYEWTQDSLSVPAIDNKVIDGEDITQNDTAVGVRVGNHSQTSVKAVAVSTRAIESDTIGRANEKSYQVMMRQQELKRDMEAQMLSNSPSIAGTDAVAGQSGGLNAWLETNVSLAATPGTVGGYNTATGIVDAFVTGGAAEALTETKVRDVAESIYTEGGNPSIFMAVPKVIRAFSEYLFTSSARIATLTAETNQKGPATGVGSVSIFVTDFGVTLDLIPNRLQAETVAGESTAFLIDPQHVRQSFLHSVRTEPLAKTGLSEKSLMSADYTLVVTTEKAHGMITDIDNSAPVTA